MKTAEFGKPCAAVPQPGRCRVCGCGDGRDCEITTTIPEAGVPPRRWLCNWADETRTLCNSPACIAEAKRELGLVA